MMSPFMYALRLLLLIVALGLMPPEATAQPTPQYAGKRLAEALQILQARGLRIVFSSETVTPAMRVAAEPRARSDQEMLAELLAPHGLRAQQGPGGTVLVVRARSVPQAGTRAPPRRATPDEVPQADHPPPYRERVRVEGSHDTRQEPGVVSESTLGRSELGSLRAVVADDPIREAQALPHVAAGDDFRSEFSVRGSAYRHVGVVIDGVATRWLQHTAYGRGDTGSLAMFTGDALEGATLRAGAYPQRYPTTLGAQLGLTVREGSRESTAFRAAVSGTSATLFGEGPVGGSERGSWLFSARRSYRDWPLRGFGQFDGTVFGFTDALAKIVYDVGSYHQVSLSALGGQSSVDEPDGGAPHEPGDGTNRTAVVNVGVRSTLGSRTVLTQRAYGVTQAFLNQDEAGQPQGRGGERETSYRADLAHETPGGLLEAGAQIQRLHGTRSGVESSGEVGASAWMRSGYVHFRWQPSARLVIAPGIRVADSTLARSYPVGRWVLGEWALGQGWALNASAGVSHQFAALEQAGSADLEPERATHVDLGVGQRLTTALRWQATAYLRRERDGLRDDLGTWRNALDGNSKGVELMVERQRPTGLSGWIAYSFGKTRYTDVTAGEAYWADFDQRHGVNLFAVHRFSDRTSVAVTFRGGTNFPIPGYLTVRDGRLLAGSERNTVRLRPYARLDVRATRSFELTGRRLTLYVEVLNALNRTNLGLGNGYFNNAGEAVGFTERLMPRLPSAGIVVEF